MDTPKTIAARHYREASEMLEGSTWGDPRDTLPAEPLLDPCQRIHKLLVRIFELADGHENPPPWVDAACDDLTGGIAALLFVAERLEGHIGRAEAGGSGVVH